MSNFFQSTNINAGKILSKGKTINLGGKVPHTRLAQGWQVIMERNRAPAGTWDTPIPNTAFRLASLQCGSNSTPDLVEDYEPILLLEQ